MKILVSSLEPSANLHLEAIKNEIDFEMVGIFDKSFGEPLYDSSEFSVMGIFDALGKIFKAKEAIKEMLFLAKDADKILLIDSPAFNLPLAKAIKEKYPDKKIIYYILPKVWAWKKSRAKKVVSYCDEVCGIFPFEKKFYSKFTYVGNPLLDEIKVFNDGKKKNQVAFLPGSRKSEIKRLMPVFKEIAKEIKEKKILVIPKFFDQKMIKQVYGDIDEFDISYDTHKTLAESDFAFICSGTATLESAIIGTPFVLAYKAKSLDYFIGSRLVKLPYVGLANILLDFEEKEPLHKEFLQDSVTKENLLKEFETINIEDFKKKSSLIKEILKYGSSKNMAKILNGEG